MWRNLLAQFLDGCPLLQHHRDLGFGQGTSTTGRFISSYQPSTSSLPTHSSTVDFSSWVLPTWSTSFLNGHGAVKCSSALCVRRMTFGSNLILSALSGYVQTRVFTPSIYCLVLVQMRSCLVLFLIIPQHRFFLSETYQSQINSQRSPQIELFSQRLASSICLWATGWKL